MNTGEMRIKGLMGALLFCVSAQAASQICESERQQVITATNGKNNAKLEDTKKWVEDTIYNGNNWCAAFKGDVNSKEYADALRTCANSVDANAEEDHTEYRSLRLPQYKLFVCVARDMATKIKPPRRHQPSRN